MQYWIFVIVAIVAALLFSLIVFLIRCLSYRKVLQKIRTTSMSSNDSGEQNATEAQLDPERRHHHRHHHHHHGHHHHHHHPRPPRVSGAVYGPPVGVPPPLYTVESESPTAILESGPPMEMSQNCCPTGTQEFPADDNRWRGFAFPDLNFVPPPYAECPPEYVEIDIPEVHQPREACRENDGENPNEERRDPGRSDVSPNIDM